VTLAALLTLSAGCGEFTRQGHSPVLVVVESLQVASGATPDEFTGTLQSDVITDGAVYNDIAQVLFRLVLKDPGAPGIGMNPSDLNSVTINRYRVSYRRTDGRNAPGVDVPYAFDSAMTVTVTANATVFTEFQIVRHTAKIEAPLRALAFNGNIISTIAEITFYGRDQAGNEVMATANVGIDFGNFADPEPDPE
jgi:hypothetical protein